MTHSVKLTKNQLHALGLLRENFVDPKQVGFGVGLETDDPLRKSYRVWNDLVRLGLAEMQTNSEQVCGEPRVYWNEYRLRS